MAGIVGKIGGKIAESIAPGAVDIAKRYGKPSENESRIGLLGKDILKAAFPGAYDLGTKYQRMTGGKDKPRAKGSAVTESVTELSAEVINTNTILSTSIEIQEQQNIILDEILKAIKKGSTGGDGFEMPSIPDGPKVKGKGAPKTKGKAAPKAKPKAARYRDPKTGRFAKAPTGVASKVGGVLGKAGKVAGGVLKRAPLIGGAIAGGLEYAESGNVGRSVSAGAGAMGGAYAGAMAGAALGAFGGPLAPITIPLGALIGGIGAGWAGEELAKGAYDKLTGDKNKTQSNYGSELITYKGDNINFISKEMILKAKELIIKGDLSGLNLQPSGGGGILASILPPVAAGDPEAREKAGQEVGERLAGTSKGGLVQEAQSGASVRKLPISAKLKSVLTTAATTAGVNVRVTSGGQPAFPQGPRTGSTRHDLGNAADLDVIQNGRVLSDNNPADVPIKQKFASAAAAAGASGIGAGMGYMGPQKVHIGFGTTAKWGGASWLNSVNPASGGDIKAYASGTSYVPVTGPAIVGEKGPETIIGKNGITKTPGQATIVNLNQGDKVIPNPTSGSGRLTRHREMVKRGERQVELPGGGITTVEAMERYKVDQQYKAGQAPYGPWETLTPRSVANIERENTTPMLSKNLNYDPSIALTQATIPTNYYMAKVKDREWARASDLNEQQNNVVPLIKHPRSRDDSTGSGWELESLDRGRNDFNSTKMLATMFGNSN